MIKVMIYYNGPEAIQTTVTKKPILLIVYINNGFTYYKSETKNHLSIYKSMV